MFESGTLDFCLSTLSQCIFRSECGHTETIACTTKTPCKLENALSVEAWLVERARHRKTVEALASKTLFYGIGAATVGHLSAKSGA